MKSRPGTYIRTPEILKKQSEAAMGHFSHNKGLKLSLEQRKKVSEATKKAMTPERRLKISLSRKNIIYSDEHKKNISLGNK